MEVELHSDDGTQVEGYRGCTCGRLVLEQSWHIMDGLCMDCWAQGKARNVHVTEVMNAGRRVNLPDPGSRSGSKRRGKSRGKGVNAGVRKAAKMAALKRLGDAYPEMYAMLYAEERLKRGLSPVPLRTYEPMAMRGAETYEFDPVYAALFEQETADGTA